MAIHNLRPCLPRHKRYKYVWNWTLLKKRGSQWRRVLITLRKSNCVRILVSEIMFTCDTRYRTIHVILGCASSTQPQLHRDYKLMRTFMGIIGLKWLQLWSHRYCRNQKDRTARQIRDFRSMIHSTRRAEWSSLLCTGASCSPWRRIRYVRSCCLGLLRDSSIYSQRQLMPFDTFMGSFVVNTVGGGCNWRVGRRDNRVKSR